MLTREQCKKILDVLEITEGEEFYIRRHNTRSTFLYMFKVNEKGLGLYKSDDAEENMRGAMGEMLMGEILMGTLVIEKITFKPRLGEYYYLVNDEGRIREEVYEDTLFDIVMFHIGNCFRTEKEAERDRNKMLAKVKEMKEENARD